MIPEEIIEQAERALLDATDDLPDDAHVGVAAALEAVLPALREWVLETELKQVGWWNATRGMHPIQKAPDQPEHLWDCYTTDRPVFVLRQEQP